MVIIYNRPPFNPAEDLAQGPEIKRVGAWNGPEYLVLPAWMEVHWDGLKRSCERGAMAPFLGFEMWRGNRVRRYTAERYRNHPESLPSHQVIDTSKVINDPPAPCTRCGGTCANRAQCRNGRG